MNSYFSIITADTGTSLKLIPGDEAPISIKELTAYLDFNKIAYDVKTLNDAITNLDKEKIIPLSIHKLLPIRESAFITVSEDKMVVTARFYPPSNGGVTYTKDSILSELRVNKVVFGMDEAAIDAFLKERKYCTDYILAKGTPVRQGKDAFITYNFPTDNKIRPTLNEDGSVDFFNLNVLNPCKAGDVLAELTPEDRGEDGRDVMGNTIKPRDVRRLSLAYGLNIELSEDKLRLTSKVNGHVSLVDGRVFVSDLYEVENVDNSTGNIEYEGNVKVNGNICSNFTVKAKGDVIVKGVVEGAVVEAGGNVILQRGINGMSKGIIKAEGNVIAKFVENAKVIAGGYIETESVLHSELQAKTEVNVVSKKGFITGGKVTATNIIRVKTLGTAMGALTEVTVGTDPVLINKFGELNKRIADTQTKLKQMVPVLDATKQKLAQGIKLLPEQVKNLQALALSVKQLQTQLAADAEEVENMKDIMEGSSDAKIEVSGEVFPGTKITISDVSLIVKESWSYCKFVKEAGAVKMKPL